MVQTRAKIQTALDDGAGALRAAARAHHKLQRRRQRSLSGGNLSEKAARMAGRVVDGALFWTIPDELSKRFRPFDECDAESSQAAEDDASFDSEEAILVNGESLSFEERG